jgi:hypothetical protein
MTAAEFEKWMFDGFGMSDSALREWVEEESKKHPAGFDPVGMKIGFSDGTTLEIPKE